MKSVKRDGLKMDQFDAVNGEQNSATATATKEVTLQGFYSHDEEENRNWFELVRFAMQSGASKERFRAFLEDEANSRKHSRH